jgi:hypothetical protein
MVSSLACGVGVGAKTVRCSVVGVGVNSDLEEVPDPFHLHLPIMAYDGVNMGLKWG